MKSLLYSLLLLFVSVSAVAQRFDTRLSDEPLKATLPEDAKIESVAAIGPRTLAVWGTSGTFIPLKTLTAVPSSDDASEGTFSISNVLPNPANRHARVLLDRPLAHSGTIELIDNYGSVLMQSTTAAGVQSVLIDCSSLPIGLYTAVVRAGKGMSARRLVVVR